jgi:hypothetical protein
MFVALDLFSASLRGAIVARSDEKVIFILHEQRKWEYHKTFAPTGTDTMNVSYYQLTIESSVCVLNHLSHLIDKAVAYCAERKIEERVLLEARLFPDMFPLKRQIQIVSGHAASYAARLIGKEPPSYEDNENSFAELQARIAKTIAYLKTIKEADFADSEMREIRLPRRDKPMRGEVFLLRHVLPNLYFHITTAYNIMRHNGVPIGKADYLGEM